jgi:hypothetical protein
LGPGVPALLLIGFEKWIDARDEELLALAHTNTIVAIDFQAHHSFDTVKGISTGTVARNTRTRKVFDSGTVRSRSLSPVERPDEN